MIDFRRATEADFERITALFSQLWPTKKSDPARLKEILLKVTQQPGIYYVCATLNDEVVGLGSIRMKDSLWQEGTVAHVEELIVDEAHRNCGIGSALLDHLVTLAQAQRCLRIELDSGLHRPEAHKFYERKGLEKRGYVFSRRL